MKLIGIDLRRFCPTGSTSFRGESASKGNGKHTHSTRVVSGGLLKKGEMSILGFVAKVCGGLFRFSSSEYTAGCGSGSGSNFTKGLHFE